MLCPQGEKVGERRYEPPAYCAVAGQAHGSQGRLGATRLAHTLFACFFKNIFYWFFLFVLILKKCCIKSGHMSIILFDETNLRALHCGEKNSKESKN